MPDWASDKEKRLAKIQEAMAALEAEAKLAAEEERRIEAEKEQQRNAEGRKGTETPPTDIITSQVAQFDTDVTVRLSPIVLSD
jgi:hypothetical protein